MLRWKLREGGSYTPIILPTPLLLSLCPRAPCTPALVRLHPPQALVEFFIGVCVAFVAIIKLPRVQHQASFLYTFYGRGVVYVLFGALGLSPEPTRAICSGLTLAVGFLWLILGCLARQTPAVVCDFSKKEQPGGEPEPVAGGRAAQPASAGNGAGKAGTSKAGTSKAGISKADKSQAAPAHSDNPFTTTTAPNDLEEV